MDIKIISVCWVPEYEIEHKGRTWRFEDSGYGGPWPLRRSDGAPFKRVPLAFWEAYAAWAAQEERKRQSAAGALPTK